MPKKAKKSGTQGRKQKNLKRHIDLTANLGQKPFGQKSADHFYFSKALIRIIWRKQEQIKIGTIKLLQVYLSYGGFLLFFTISDQISTKIFPIIYISVYFLV